MPLRGDAPAPVVTAASCTLPRLKARGGSAMALGKTERGREALQAQSKAGLTLAERRVLILCDGRRERADIAALLGDGAAPIINNLYEAGYITLQGGAMPSAAPSAVTPPTVAFRPAAEPAAPSPAETRPAPAVPAPPTAPQPVRTASRRSLAASKMYLVDMLQLQRDPEAVALRTEIQTSPSEEELVYRMMKGLGHLQGVAAASYFQRVSDRLAEILPEQHLPRLEQARAPRLDGAA